MARQKGTGKKDARFDTLFDIANEAGVTLEVEEHADKSYITLRVQKDGLRYQCGVSTEGTETEKLLTKQLQKAIYELSEQVDKSGEQVNWKEKYERVKVALETWGLEVYEHGDLLSVQQISSRTHIPGL